MDQLKLPAQKASMLTAIVDNLKSIGEIKAIVLGGSYATGMAGENSDIDLGIYYSPDSPFDIKQVSAIAHQYAIGKPTVTGFYEWGPWVNGGAWIETSAGKVDFIYRNLDQVSGTIVKAQRGEWENDFEQQPPYGFSSIIYLAEIHICQPLYDPLSLIGRLKETVRVYPKKLKENVIRQSLWSAEFAAWHADYFYSHKDDLYNLAGCLTRAVKYIVHALLAINEIYPLGDKRAIEILQASASGPSNLKHKIDQVLEIRKDSTNNNVDSLYALLDEARNLAGEHYKPFPFELKKK